MTLKECYDILKVDQSASLEDVKRAYRRRAFELHPDLNPNVTDASRQFQLLNEAYVILTRLVTAREAAASEAAAKQAKGDHTRPGPRWYEWGFSFGSKKTESAETADAESEAAKQEEARKARQSSEERRAQREEAYREEIRREEERQRERRREEARRETARRAEQQRKAAEQARAEQARKDAQRGESPQAESSQTASSQTDSSQAERPQADAAQGASSSEQIRPDRPQTDRSQAERPQAPPRSEKIRPDRPHSTRPGTGDNVYAEQQEVLRDILNDDFARRVFEDIYSEIRKKTPPPEREVHRHPPREAARSRAENVQAESVPPKSKGGLPFGLDHFRLDFSSGVGNTVKGWLRSQIDEEQTIRLPATGLFPGARVRLQIRRGLSDDLTTIEVTLPPDFVAGKPIRLRGLGKKLGSMQGDLYLTVVAR